MLDLFLWEVNVDLEDQSETNSIVVYIVTITRWKNSRAARRIVVTIPFESVFETEDRSENTSIVSYI